MEILVDFCYCAETFKLKWNIRTGLKSSLSNNYVHKIMDKGCTIQAESSHRLFELFKFSTCGLIVQDAQQKTRTNFHNVSMGMHYTPTCMPGSTCAHEVAETKTVWFPFFNFAQLFFKPHRLKAVVGCSYMSVKFPQSLSVDDKKWKQYFNVSCQTPTCTCTRCASEIRYKQTAHSSFIPPLVLMMDFIQMQLPTMVDVQPFCQQFVDTSGDLFTKWYVYITCQKCLQFILPELKLEANLHLQSLGRSQLKCKQAGQDT